MLESIIDFINLKLGLLNYFEKTHCLSTLVKNDDGLIYPAEYISNGDFDAVDFDAYDGVSYIRVNGEIDVERVDQRYTPKPRLNVTFPLRLVYAVRKDKLTKDDAYSFDRVRGSLVKQLESDSADLANQLEADRIVVSTSNYISDTKELWDEETAETGTFQPKYEVVFGAMEVSVTVTTRAECIPSECDDFESDILRTFDFCKTNTQDRLTSTQVACLTDWLCDGTGSPVTIQINGVTYTTAPAGTTYNQEFVNTDGDAVGTAANPSVVGDATIQINGVGAGSVVAEGTYNQGFENSQGNTIGTAANPSIAGDATVTINGDSLGSEGSIPSEESNDITVNLDGSPSGSWNGSSWEVTSAACDDATVNANGVLVSNVASGGTLDIDVHDTDNNDVGTVTGTEIEISDTTVTINSSSLGATGSVLAEGSVDIDVTQGGVQVGSWDGSTWVIPTAGSCPSVSLALSSTTPDFGDTITLTATATGFTGTVTYYFAVLNNTGSYDRITQVGDNTYDYTCVFVGAFGVEVVAVDGFGNMAVGFATLTVSWSIGRAIDLNGTTQSVETIDNQFSNIVNCKNWVLGFWFKADSLSNSPIIISGNETDFYIQIRTTDIRVRCTFGNTKTFTTSISTATAYNVLLYRDDVGDNIKCYINGVEITTTSGTSGANPELNTKFVLGDYPVGGFEFNGQVTHLFCIQGYTMTSAQALAFYNSGNGEHPYFLLDKYPDWYIDFQDRVTDQGSRGYDCQLVNAPSYTDF